MDSTTTPAFFLLLLSIITIYHIGFGTALHVEVHPEPVNPLVENEVNITCHLSEAPDWDENVILVELGKKGEHPIAILEKAKLNYGRDRKMNVKAEGRIVKDSNQSFLRLTISDPGAGDAGTYSCSVFYTDDFGQIKEDKKEANLTVDNDNDKGLVHLLKKVSDLEKTADTQGKLLKEQNAQTKDLENTVAQQNKELKKQQNNTKDLENTVAQQKKELKEQQVNMNTFEKELKDQKDKMNTFEKELKEQQLGDQCSINDTVTIAFSYAYNTNDKLVPGKPLLFMDKIMSIGDAYDPKSGVFTAPRDGLYVFHLTVMTYSQDDYIYIDLKVNGKELARLYVEDGDYQDQGSVSSVTSLKAGDRVQPVVYSFPTNNNDASGGRYSTFSGHLVKLL